MDKNIKELASANTENLEKILDASQEKQNKLNAGVGISISDSDEISALVTGEGDDYIDVTVSDQSSDNSKHVGVSLSSAFISMIESLQDRVTALEEKTKTYTGEVGDAVLYDNVSDGFKIVSIDDLNTTSYPTSRYTAIGVVAVPSSHNVYGNNKCGVMSLGWMDPSNPDIGTASLKGAYSGNICWGGYGTDTGLSNMNVVATTGTGSSQSSSVTGTSSNAYIPCDFVLNNYASSSTACPTDPKAAVYNLYTAAPSPYLSDGSRNPVYYQTSSPSSSYNALSDFNGVANTSALLELATSQSNWKTASTISNSTGAGYYPAACCCWRYYTDGTSQGDWYLPACGELGYVGARRDALNTSLSKITSLYSGTGTHVIAMSEFGTIGSNAAYHWSSTEYDSSYARLVYLGSYYTCGHVYDCGKSGTGNSARAFVQV